MLAPVFSSPWLATTQDGQHQRSQARERYVEALLDESYTKNPHELLDPCLPTGLRTTLTGEVLEGDSPDTVLMGTGQFDKCLARAYPLLDKDAPCEDNPCLLHGQHVPAIDFEVNHFVGVSEYWHTTHEVFEMAHKDKAYDFTTYQRMVKDFCSEEWDDIMANVAAGKWGKKVDAKTAQEVCFKASWLINVLHDGIGIPRVGIEKSASGPGYNGTKEVAVHTKDKGFLDPFQAVNKIDDMEVSWTLGKMVLYAAGQIPPSASEALPVGFGPNLGGGPFQEAGSNYNPVPIGDDDETWSEAAEDLAEKAHSRSTPGFLLFMITLIFLFYIFRKRERRHRLYRGINSTFRRSRRPGSPRKGGRGFFSSSKLFGGRSSGNYERVMEDGVQANDFELAEAESSSSDNDNEHSDSSEGSRIGRTSGLATPKMNVVNFDSANYFEGGVPSQGVGLGLNHGGLSAMDRSGLVVRTESRERLGPSLQMLGAGRRSRAGSPTRMKSPLMTPLEEV